MVTISTRRGLFISAPNQNFPKSEQIAALRLLMAERLAAKGPRPPLPLHWQRLPILGRVPSTEAV